MCACLSLLREEDNILCVHRLHSTSLGFPGCSSFSAPPPIMISFLRYNICCQIILPVCMYRYMCGSQLCIHPLQTCIPCLLVLSDVCKNRVIACTPCMHVCPALMLSSLPPPLCLMHVCLLHSCTHACTHIHEDASMRA